MMSHESSVLPVTILTGFLGAGKTTLINQLLKQADNERIAIVENEFGAVNIDGQLLSGSNAVEVVELSNGCVCCSVRGELTEALQELLRKRDSGELQIDRLILETTGLADPAPIIQTFFVDETIRERIVLDAVVCLVDAEHILKQLDEHRVAASQIGFADCLIVGKSDRVSESELSDVVTRLRAINNRSQVLQVNFGQVPKHHWIGIHAFELSDALAINQGYHLLSETNEPVLKPLLQRSTPSKSWDDSIQAVAFEAPDLDIKKIGGFMEEMIALHGNDMLRYKGVLSIADQNQRLIVQGIHKVVGFDYGSEWLSTESRQSLLVIIGRDLPWQALKEQFLACVA